MKQFANLQRKVELWESPAFAFLCLTTNLRQSSTSLIILITLLNLSSIEHVGIGTDSDLDGYDDLPEEMQKKLREGYKSSYSFREKIDIEGFDHPRKVFDLTEALIRRKYSDSNIEKILGGNFKRLLLQIWGS